MKRRAVFLPMKNCPHRCVYCDQGAITGEHSYPSPDYVRSLLGTEDSAIELCYFGGSFTCQPQYIQEQYLEVIEDAPCGSIVRFSTHPLCINRDLLNWLKRYPISMIELGISSLDNHVLDLCNRGYRAQEALLALSMIQDTGIPACAQIMIGLPGQSIQSSVEDLQKLAFLKGPKDMTLRIYPCLVLKDTRLEIKMREGKYTPLSFSKAVLWAGTLLFHALKLGFHVQRIGLQETGSLNDAVIAGPHHPSFGEFAKSVSLVLTLLKNSPYGPWILRKKDISLLKGHHNFGLDLLAEKTRLTPKDAWSRIYIWDRDPY